MDHPLGRRGRIALAWQVGLAAYMQLISWIPLGRWNYQPCCPPGFEQLRRGTLTPGDAFGAAAFLLPCLLFWSGLRLGRRWLMWAGFLPTAIWLGLQIWSWWPPYIFGASDSWSRVYARAFAESTPILPRWGNHLPPDALHFTLQVLLLGAVVSGAMALMSPRAATRVESP
jgi:hypothetical protein